MAHGTDRRHLLRGLAGGVLAVVGFGRAAQASCPRETPISCGSACVDLRTDPANCGRCGRGCATELCYAGRCLTNCPSGFEACDGTCTRQGACSPPPPPPFETINGELTLESAHFFRCGIPDEPGNFYDAYPITHPGGPLQILHRGLHSGGGTLSDPYLSLYSSFDPSAPCANRVAFNDDGGCVADAYIALSDLAAGPYVIVATAFIGGSGTYTLTYGPGPLDPSCPDE